MQCVTKEREMEYKAMEMEQLRKENDRVKRSIMQTKSFIDNQKDQIEKVMKNVKDLEIKRLLTQSQALVIGLKDSHIGAAKRSMIYQNSSYFENGKYQYPPVQAVEEDEDDIGGILDNRIRAHSTLSKTGANGGVAIQDNTYNSISTTAKGNSQGQPQQNANASIMDTSGQPYVLKDTMQTVEQDLHHRFSTFHHDGGVYGNDGEPNALDLMKHPGD